MGHLNGVTHISPLPSKATKKFIRAKITPSRGRGEGESIRYTFSSTDNFGKFDSMLRVWERNGGFREMYVGDTTAILNF